MKNAILIYMCDEWKTKKSMTLIAVFEKDLDDITSRLISLMEYLLKTDCISGYKSCIEALKNESNIDQLMTYINNNFTYILIDDVPLNTLF